MEDEPMTYDPIPMIFVVTVIGAGVISASLFFVFSSRHKEIISAYMAPGLISASLISPILGIVCSNILSIRCIQRIYLSNTFQPVTLASTASVLRDANKPLFYGLALALLCCVGLTVYFRLKLMDALLPSTSNRSAMPALFSILLLVTSVIPFFLYHRAQTVLLSVLSVDQHLSGRSPQSVAGEIELLILATLFTSLLAAAVAVGALVLSLVFSNRRKECLMESHMFIIYGANLMILIGILATASWYV
jgi:hypothetical protein